MTPRSGEREGGERWGEAALLPPPPSCPARSHPSPRLSPIPHAGPRPPLAASASPAARPQRPPPHPPTRRCSACNIHKKHTQVGATSPGRALRRASAYLRAAAAALGKGRGRGCGGGEGGWVGGGVRAAPVRPGRAVPEQLGGHALHRGVRASGSPSRPPSRLMLRVGAQPAPRGPGRAAEPSRAGGRSPSLRSRRSSEVKVSGATTGRSQR